MNKIFYIILIGLLTLFIIKTCRNNNKYEDIYKVFNDSIKKYKDKEGLIHNKIQVLEGINKNNLELLSIKDKELKSVIEKNKKLLKNGGNVVTTKTEVKIDTIFETILIKDSMYQTPFNLGGWVYGELNTTKDSTKIDLKIKEQIDVIWSKEKTGFLGLGKSKNIVDITLHNPYNEVKTIRAVNFNDKKESRFAAGIGVYYGLSSKGLEPFVGVGVQYNLIKF